MYIYLLLYYMIKTLFNGLITIFLHFNYWLCVVAWWLFLGWVYFALLLVAGMFISDD